jgi:hypothetical protein
VSKVFGNPNTMRVLKHHCLSEAELFRNRNESLAHPVSISKTSFSERKGTLSDCSFLIKKGAARNVVFFSEEVLFAKQIET